MGIKQGLDSGFPCVSGNRLADITGYARESRHNVVSALVCLLKTKKEETLLVVGKPSG